MKKEWHIIGPPGTGKTYAMARNAERAADKYGNEEVLLLSLTKAGAREIGSRSPGIPDGNKGTLHAHCYRALGKPNIVERKHYEEWNQEFPHLKITIDKGYRSLAESKGINNERFRGDTFLKDLDLCRSLMIPKGMMKAGTKSFEKKWTEWKNERDLLDFTDLIEICNDSVVFAPSQPSVILGDEAQDFSKLELSLFRKWMHHSEQGVLAGDVDQALYHWRGSDPNVFSVDITSSQVKPLMQSYRVPRAAHKLAMKIIRSVPKRLDIDYKPKDEDGSMRRVSANYKTFASLIPTVKRYTEDGKSVMVLVTCDYMLNPIIRVLRNQGIPYHNPYTVRWNPLRKQSNGVSSLERIGAFMRPHVEQDFFEQTTPNWSIGELRKWIPMIRSDGILKYGAKRVISKRSLKTTSREVSKLLWDIFEDEVIEKILDGDLRWLERNLIRGFQSSAQYPLSIIKKKGIRDFTRSINTPPTTRPWVTVGTIHSVKGGQADAVIVFPDLSPSGFRTYQKPGWFGIDSIKRLLYVAVTRTKSDLIVGSPAGRMFARIG